MKQHIMGVPAFEINGQFVTGLDPKGIEEALKHEVFPCPQCGRSLRAPTGKGKLKITCPSCGNQFIKE